MSCKQNDSTSPAKTTEVVYAEAQTKDVSNIETAVDEVMNNIDNQINSSGARIEDCGITNTTITGSKKSYKFTFQTTSCTGVNSKTGEVILTLESGNRFSDAGSIWKKQYKDVVFTTKENKTLTLNGDVYLSNVTGGFPVYVLLAQNSPVVHRVKSSNLSIKLDTTPATRQFSLARKYTWTNVSNKITGTIEGDTTIGSYTKLILWGKNRFGQNFYSQLGTPAVFGLKCGSRPVSATRTNTIERNDGNIVSNETISTTDACVSTYSIQLTYGNNSFSYSLTY